MVVSKEFEHLVSVDEKKKKKYVNTSLKKKKKQQSERIDFNIINL